MAIQIRRVLLYLTMMVLPLAALLADPVPVPQWARPVENLLPKLSPSIISEVDDLFKIIDDPRHGAGDGSTPDAESAKASIRLAGLREQAGQAMIWQYLKEQPDPNESEGAAAVRTVMRRTNLLRRLSDDPDLPQWLLPLLRTRMKWLESRIENHQIDDSNTVHEIAGIDSYLSHRGGRSDIELLEQLTTTGIKAGYFAGYFDNRRTVDEQVQHMEKARAEIQFRTTPYWKSVALPMIHKGLLDKATLDVPQDRQSPRILGNPDVAPLSDRYVNNMNDLRGQQKNIERPTISRMILGGLTVAAVLLLYLLLKKRNDLA